MLTGRLIITHLLLLSSPGNSQYKYPRNAQELLENLKEHFDLNWEFQLRRIGLSSGAHDYSNTTRCYGSLGCLNITEEWYGVTRPVNVLPQNRRIINTQFLLRTRRNRNSIQYLNGSKSVIESSNYDSQKLTKLIIHGFLDSASELWVQRMSEGLLEYGDYNVIAVDWNGGSTAIYSQAAANTRLVGLEVAAFIQFLVDNYQSSLSNFHLIGHSLGSHISGYAGEALKSKNNEQLGRITGLDPAEPLFKFTPPFIRLDPSDAEFVDVIHTDAQSLLMLGYGMTEPVGHVDFYPNGGYNQPGCALTEFSINVEHLTSDTVGRHLVACSHDRALSYFTESLRCNSSCSLIGYKCSSYDKFLKGGCFSCGENNEHCALLGIEAIRYKAHLTSYKQEINKFYLKTGAVSPFCQTHILLEMFLASPKEAERWVQGYLRTNLYGSKGEKLDVNLTPKASERLAHGTKVSFIFAISEELGDLSLVGLEWTYDHDINPLALEKVCVLYCGDQIYIKKLRVRMFSTSENSLSLCTNTAVGYSKIESGKSKLFYQKCSN